MIGDTEVQKLRALHSSLRVENERLSNAVGLKEEELGELEEQLDNARRELAHRQDEARRRKTQMKFSGESESTTEEEMMAAQVVNDILLELSTHVLEKKEDSSTRSEKPLELGSEQLLKCMKRTDDNEFRAQSRHTEYVQRLLGQARASMQDLYGGNGATGNFRTVLIHRISQENAEERFKVNVTSEVRFAELCQLAMKRWGLSLNDPRFSHVLVDEAGTTWPDDARVFRDVCKDGVTASLYLDSTDRVEFTSLQPKLVKFIEGIDSHQSSTQVAPLLGEHANRKAKKALELSGEKKEEEKTGKDSAKTRAAVIASTLHGDPLLMSKRMLLLDVFLMLCLFLVMLAHVLVENVSLEFDATEELTKAVRIPFSSYDGSMIDFLNISSWEDVAGFAAGPVLEWFKSNSDRRARNKIIMPLRWRQNRVKQFAQGSDSCPAVYDQVKIEMLSNVCYPDFSSSNQAETFYQGSSNETLNSGAFMDGLSETVSNAFRFRSNSWWLPQKLALPNMNPDPLSQSDWDVERFGPFPSEGYVIDVPFNISNPESVISVFDLIRAETGGLTWLDDQTRFVSMSVVFYNANFKAFIQATFSVTIDANGFFRTIWSANALVDLLETPKVILLVADAFSLLIIAYMFYVLSHRFKYQYRLSVERLEAKRLAERRRRLTEAFPTTHLAMEETPKKVSGVKVFLVFVSRLWNLLDLFIIGVALCTFVFASICRWCQRYRNLTIPSPAFVTMNELMFYTSASRICASHAMAFILFKLYKYVPIKPYTNLEFGTIFFSLGRILAVMVIAFLVLLGISLASFQLTGLRLNEDALFLTVFFEWLEVWFSYNLSFVTPNQSILSYVIVIGFILLVNGFLIKFLVGIANQGRSKVSTERMRLESDQSASAAQEGKLFITRMFHSWFHHSTIGRPNF